jgi:hypothetical protein
VTDAAEERDLVRFEAHARAAPVAEATPRELVRYVGRLDREARREPLDDHHQGAPVGLTGRQETEHDATLPDA